MTTFALSKIFPRTNFEEIVASEKAEHQKKAELAVARLPGPPGDQTQVE